MKLLERPLYLSAIKSRLGFNMIVCLTGQRRVGKSSILKTLREELEQSSANVIYINKEKNEFDSITDYTHLNDYIHNNLSDTEHNYILIDEVQNIDGFQKSLGNYYDRDNIDIVVTGSNAKMFSGELATLLSGRYFSIHIGSLSYPEFMTFHGLEDNDQSLNKYLNTGGLPNLRLLPIDDSNAVNDYLQSIYSTIVLKDVVEREGIRNVAFLERLTRYIADNIGKLFSVTNIATFMANEKDDVPSTTVKNYMRSLCNAYIINKIDRWDVRGKQILSTNEKYYFEDLGLRNILTSGNRKFDIEKLLENAVYLHLKTMGYTVNIGAMRAGEVDFVASKGNDRVYLQVAYLIASEETYNREFGTLMKIKDNYPKMVVSMDPLYSESSYDGIIHIPLRKFLTMSAICSQ